MALQSNNLVMVGLGVLGDQPPNALQPPLVDGVHLRWAFRREVGFPWYGFYLFRRLHRRGDPICLGLFTQGLRPGLQGRSEFKIPSGTLDSDANLVLTNDFPSPPSGGTVEFDLNGRRSLRFTFDQPVRRVAVTLGFRQDAEIELRAGALGRPVAEARVQGQAGQVRQVSLEYDVITELTISSGPAALVDLCFVPVSQDGTVGWELIPGCPYPLSLPVRHPDYPCSGAPVDLAASEATALGRVHYGPAGDWAGAPFASLHEQLLLLVTGGPAGLPMAERLTPRLVGAPVPPNPAATSPAIPGVSRLDLVLLGALNPPIAQMLGLSWADQTTAPGVAHDYLILADHDGRAGRDPDVMRSLLRRTGYLGLDGYVVFNKARAPSTPLPSPRDLRVYALPGTSVRTQAGDTVDSTNVAGLRWDLEAFTGGGLLPERALMYHVWHAYLGEGEPAAPPPADGYELATKRGPLLVPASRLPSGVTPERPPDWPPFPLHALEGGLRDGWHGFAVNGIDIFGRHSAHSAPGVWNEWAPMPEPRPWYYQDPPGDRAIHPFALRLLDWTPPPPPTGVEAWALDPADPFAQRDVAYTVWWATLSPAEQASVVGLRVRWRWTQAQMRQAPDTREFRIYFHPGTHLPLPDHSLSIAWQERCHVVDYDDSWQPGVDASGRPLRQYEVLLPAPAAVFRGGVPLLPTLAEPIAYAHIGVTSADDKNHAPDAPQWTAGRWGDRPGNESRLGPPARIFRVLRTPPDPPVPPPDSERAFATPADYHARSFYTYRFRPSANLKTHVFRALDDAVFKTDWLMRTVRGALDPAVEAHGRLFSADWGPGRRRAAASALNALAGPGDYAQLPPDAVTLLARLPGNANRVAGETVAQRDWTIRVSRSALREDLPYFPGEWEPLQRRSVIGELNVITAFSDYRGLSNDSLRVLAGLPGNEAAFTQITLQPLDPGDPANENRVGPDNAADYPVDPELHACTDTLPGRAETLEGDVTNRYFYRAAYVDGAHNRSALSLSGPPVWLRDVVAPRAPVITRVQGGDRRITLVWASNREPDLAEYRVYRADSEANARDLRLMTLVHTEVVAPGPPAARPMEVSYMDGDLMGRDRHHYRMTAVDRTGNVSVPSAPVSMIVVDTSIPDAPVWTGSVWVLLRDVDGVQEPWPADGVVTAGRRMAIALSWVSAVPRATFQMTRRVRGEGAFRPVATHGVYLETAPGAFLFHDTEVVPGRTYSYRLRQTSVTGIRSVTVREIEVPRP